MVVEKNILQVYPNPATTEIWVAFNSHSQMVTLTVSDLYGRQVKQEETIMDGSYKISLDGLDDGLYILSVFDSETVYTSKVLKR